MLAILDPVLDLPVCPPHMSSLPSSLCSTSAAQLVLVARCLCHPLGLAPTLLHLEHCCLLSILLTQRTTSQRLPLPQWNPHPRHYSPPPGGRYLSNSRPHTPPGLPSLNTHAIMVCSFVKTFVTYYFPARSDQPSHDSMVP